MVAQSLSVRISLRCVADGFLYIWQYRYESVEPNEMNNLHVNSSWIGGYIGKFPAVVPSWFMFAFTSLDVIVSLTVLIRFVYSARVRT